MNFKENFNNIRTKSWAFTHAQLKKFYEMQREEKIKFIAITIILLLIISIIYYVNSKFKLYKYNCKVLKKVYDTRPSLGGLDSNSPYLLRDYYIKTAYNCCASGQFKADFVGLCALRTCIEQGVRALDFEIYSMDDKPVVAVSSVKNFTFKESFNSISTADIFNTIMNMAFSASNCPNPNDPLILHFRILSKNVPMYDTLASEISNIMNSRILGVDYSFEFGGKNLGAVPIKNFLGKIIIIADASNPLYQKTKLDEYINMTSGSPFMKLMTFQQLKFTQDLTLKDFNKKNMSIVLPDWSANDQNPNFNISREYGAQLIGMSFQNYDSNLEYYNAFFDGNKTAFVLKPKELRFVPLTIKIPPKAPPAYSYQARAVTTSGPNVYYNYRI